MQDIVDGKLGLIQKLIDTRDYDVAVKESCTVFELVFRQIFQQAVVSLSYQDREHILEVERRIGKGTKGAQDFGFGELVGLFRESNLMDKWSKHTSRDLGLIRSLDYSSIVNLRNRITHQGASCSGGEANIVYEYLRNLLAVLGYAHLEGSINRSFSQTPAPVTESAQQPTADRLPKINKTHGKSMYSSSYATENKRLKIQSNIFRDLDLRAFREVLDPYEATSDLMGLDLGCASGHITNDRFGTYLDRFRHVVGIDINGVKIEEANNGEYGSKFSFHELDVESSNFEDDIEAVLQQHGEEQFDIIFSALTLHHLANPQKALFKLRKLLKKGGYILLRGSDDGTKIAYPDEQNLVATLIRMTQDIQGASDRENGRKLYSQLWESGFRDIRVLHQVNDTAGRSPEEREALFQQSFSYRKNNFKKRLEQHPNDPQFREEYEWVRDALEELEMKFANEGFYYMELATIAIGRK